MNTILTIRPYKLGYVWVFDDERVGLCQEPFVPSAGVIIDKLVKDANIENAEKGFTLLFSACEFPDSHKLNRVSSIYYECCGDWYRSEKYGLEGWLCPALLKYFVEAPQYLYVQAVK